MALSISRKSVFSSLSPEDQAKLAALRADINSAIERGGSFTDEEVAEYIEQIHSDAEREKQ